MNILFLINFAGKGGSEKYVLNLCRIFRDGGQSCRLCYNVDGELSETLAAEGFPLFKLDMGRAASLSAAKKLADYCREHEIDVIHAQYPRENVIALESKRYYGAPRVVYTNHLTIRSGLRWRILNRRYTPKNHRIIAVCREGREIMIDNGVCPERIEVIYNGVEPAGPRVADEGIRAELGVPDDAFMMTIFARYEPEKGLFFLLDSLSALKGLTDRPFVCVICGDGSQFDEVGARISALGLDKNVIRAGFRRDGERILRGAELYLNSSSHNEAMSFAILEAMNAGLPCVVTDVGGNRDLAETNTVCGAVLDFGDVEGFSRAIFEYMENDALRLAHSEAALKKISEEFDLKKLAWDVFRAYQ